LKVVILAGGRGSRLAEETDMKPKPMVEIGGRPILWHIMKHYAHHGFKEFFIALGYRGESIKRYFLDYRLLNSSMTVDLSKGEVTPQSKVSEDWIVHLMDTGLETFTGGRVKRLERWLKNETFMATYGDGVGNVDLQELVRFHRSQGKLVTVTAVRPPARFGGLNLKDGQVRFTEKSQANEGWINGGFLVLEPSVLQYISGDTTSLEAEIMERLAAEGQLAAFKHEGFWQAMDTIRDVKMLESLWQSGKPPWKVWE
jgi:glucose-1-phosphate cytidylyltransferase